MARVINYEGRRIEVPDDFSDDDVAEVLASSAPAAPAPAQAPTAPAPRQPEPSGSDLDAMIRGVAPAPPAAPRPPQSRGEQAMDVLRGALGVVDQGARGVAQGAVTLAGLPVDLAALALNGAAAAGGAGVRFRNPVLGSAFNKQALDTANDRTIDVVNAVTGADLGYPQREPAGPIERGVNRIGQELGAAALPTGAALATAARVGREGARQLNPVVRPFVEQAAVSPSRFAAKEGAAATAAGLGAALMNETTRAAGVKEGSAKQQVGDLVGSFGGLGLWSIGSHIAPRIADVFNAVRGSPNFADRVSREAVVDQIAEAAGLPGAGRDGGAPDVQPIIDSIRNGSRVDDVVPGYQESLADRTQSPGIAALEYGRQATGSGVFASRNAQNSTAIDEALQALAPQGSPGALRGTLEARRSNLLHDAASAQAEARARFEQAAGRLQSAMSADARGADIRAPLEDALRAARDIEGQAWRGVGDAGEADIRPLVESFRGVGQRMSTAEREVFEPRQLTGIPRRFLPAEEAATSAASAVDNAVLDGMSAEDRAIAERLLQPSAPAQPAAPSLGLTDLAFPSTAGTEDRIMAAIARMPPSAKPTMAGRGRLDIWDLRAQLPDMSEADLRAGLLNLQNKGHGVLSQYSDPKSIPKGTNGIDIGGQDYRHLFFPERESVARFSTPEPPATAAAAPAAAADEAVPVALREATGLRSALTDAQREAASSGQTNRARIIGQYIDAVDGYLDGHMPGAVQDAYAQARAVSRDLNDRFTRPQTGIAQALDRQEGQYRLPDSAVPRRFVQSDEGRVADFDALMREAGGDYRARAAVEDQILHDVQRLSPEQLDEYVRTHGRVFQQFPGLRARLEEAGGLRRTADAATARQTELTRSLGDETTPGSSSVGRYLRYGDAQSETAMRGVLNAADPAKAMDEVLNFAGNALDAVEGGRRIFWDLLEKNGRRQGETTAAVGGGQPWMPRAMSRFLDDPRNAAVAERLYRDNPEHLADIRRIAEAIQSVDVRQRARAPNTSGTAQGLSNVLTPETLQSRIGSYQRGQISGSFLVTSIAAVTARRAVKKAQTQAIGRMLDEALLNPEAAAVLLRENNPANRALLARRAKAWMGNQASTLAGLLNDEDEDPVRAGVSRQETAR